MLETHCLLSGQVQGVGLRSILKNYAEKNNLKGWVKNLSNGTVLLVLQASHEEIQLCIQYLEQLRYPVQIKNISISHQEIDHLLDTFIIKKS